MGKEKEKEAEGGFNLTSLRKPLRGLSLAIGLIGLFVLLIFSFMINDGLDRTEKSILNNLEETRQNLIEIEETLGTLEEGMDSADNAIETLQNSTGPLSEGLRTTGDALEVTAVALSVLDMVGVDIFGATEKFGDAAQSMKSSADELSEAADAFKKQKTTLRTLKQDLARIKQGIASQRETLGETKAAVEDVFSLARLANIFFFFVIASMFVMLMLNSVAGLV